MRRIRVSDDIRPATDDDLMWLRNGFDPEQIAEQVRREIELAQTASPTPKHWRPAEIDEVLLR
jgi:hypothetical protein